VDVFSQQRVSELRQEIASLQHDNDLYRLHGHRNKSGVDMNELRRLRLLAIKEELVRMAQQPSGRNR
jgi:hypothetical protein